MKRDQTGLSGLSPQSRAFLEFPEGEMQRLVERAKESGYVDALDLLARRDPALATLLLSNIRADWLFHCYDRNRRGRCLDVGSGWGSLAFPLAKYFDEIISLDTNRAKLSFQSTRASQKGVGNVLPVMANMTALPFGEQQFDLIISNGVLEWAALSREGNPTSVQLQFLEEIRRCLRPGGCLYVGTDNRYGLTFWLGAREHTSLPFTGILPRRIADAIVSRLLRRHHWTRYHTYTHSFRGYNALLKKAGFSNIDFYWTYPSYNYPKFAGRLDDGSSYAFLALYHLSNYPDMAAYKRAACLIAMFLPLTILQKICQLLWPNYLIFAWRDYKSRTTEDVIAQFARARSLVRISGRDSPYSKISWVGLDKRQVRSFTKLWRRQGRRNVEEEENLQKNHAKVDYFKHSPQGLTLFTEEPIGARPYSLHESHDARQAIHWLLRFQDSTASQPLTKEDVDHEKEEIDAALSQIQSGKSLSETLEQVEDLGRLLSSARMPKCGEHGDFAPNNIFFSRTGEVLVIDWEFYRPTGNLVFDPCFFVVSVSSAAVDDRSFDRNLSGRGPYSSLISDYARTFCSERRLPAEAFILGIPYVLARCVARCSIYSNDPSPQMYDYLRLLKVWNEKIRHRDLSWIVRT